MNHDIAIRWAQDLRDNADKQGRGVLQDSKGNFCCLGRLCDLAIQDGVYVSKSQLTLLSGVVVVSYDNNVYTLPMGVQTWAGMHSAEGRRGNQTDELTNANDDGTSFHGIADIIEAEWATL